MSGCRGLTIRGESISRRGSCSGWQEYKGMFTSCEARRGGSQVHILMFSASSSRYCGCIAKPAGVDMVARWC